MSLVVATGCQGFPGTVPINPTGILGDDVLSTVVTGMSPAEANQLKQHRLALQIKKAGGDVNINMALYPASTVVGVDLHQTQVLDADLLQLRAFPNLRTLNLYATHITDAGLENIAPLRSLQTFAPGQYRNHGCRPAIAAKTARLARAGPHLPRRLRIRGWLRYPI